MLASKSIRQQYRGYTITVAQVLGSWRCSIATVESDVPQMDRSCSEYDNSGDALSDAKRRIDEVCDRP